MLKSEEMKKRIAASVKLWWTGPRRRRQARLVRAYWRAHPERLDIRRTPESSAKHARTLRLRWSDPQFRAAMSMAMKRGWTTKARRRLGRSKLGHTLSAETRERMSRAALARWALRRAGGYTAPRVPDAADPVERPVQAALAAGPGKE